MGTFFTNVQVFSPGDPEAARQAVMDAVRAHVTGFGLVETAESDATRSVLVSPPGKWIGVYDQLTQGQNPVDLIRLTRALSRDVGTRALGILVHDSDTVDVQLLHLGKPKDHYCNAATDDAAQTRGKPPQWEKLLASGFNKSHVAHLFKSEWPMAEDFVTALAPLLGGDPAYFSGGFDDFSTETAGFTRLSFKDPLEAFNNGPPQLELGAFTPTRDMLVGNPLQVGTWVNNVGKTAQGVTVEVTGSALEQQLIQLDTIMFSWKGKGGVRMRVPAGLQPSPSGLTAVLAEAALPQSPLWGAEDDSRIFDQRLSRQLHVIPQGVALKRGVGDLHVRIMATQAPQNAVVHSTVLTIR